MRLINVQLNMAVDFYFAFDYYRADKSFKKYYKNINLSLNYLGMYITK